MQVIPVLFIILIIMFLFPAEAEAYLDPGSGSYFIQILLASFLGALYLLKVYWKKILHWIKGTLTPKKKCRDE